MSLPRNTSQSTEIPLESLVKKMTAIDSGLQIRDHVYFFTLYPSCVTGKAISEWLIQRGLVGNKFESTTIGQKLIEGKHMASLTKSKHFAPESNLFYRFSHDQETAKKLSAQWRQKPEYKKKMEETEKILESLKNSKTGILLKDRTYIFYKYPSCFDGKTLVTWLVDNKYFVTRQQATEFGIHLLNENLIYHVARDKPFSDTSSYFYRFADTSLTNLEELRKISDKKFEEIQKKLLSEKTGIKPKILSYSFTTWQHVFFGSDLIKWLLEHEKDIVGSEQSAIDLADKLLNEKFIVVVPSTLRIPKFIPSEVLYRFSRDPQQIKVIEGNGELEMTQQFEQVRKTLDLEEHRSGLKIIKRCFKGSSLVNWMVERGPCHDRKDAINYCNLAWKEGFIRSTSDYMFHDSESLFFKFKKKYSTTQLQNRSSQIEMGNILSDSRTFWENSDSDSDDEKPQKGLRRGFSNVRKSVNNLFAQDQSKHRNKSKESDSKSFEIQMEWYCPVGGDRCVRLPRDEVNRLRRSDSFTKKQENKVLIVSSGEDKVAEKPNKDITPVTEEMKKALEILNSGGYANDISQELWELIPIRSTWSAIKITAHQKRNRKLLDEIESFNETRGINAKALKHPDLPKQIIVIQSTQDFELLAKKHENMLLVKNRWESTLIDDLPQEEWNKTLRANHHFKLEFEKAQQLKSKLKPACGQKVRFPEEKEKMETNFLISPYYGATNLLDENGRHIVPGAVSKWLAQDAIEANQKVQALPEKERNIIQDELIEAFESVRVNVPIHIQGTKHHEDEMVVTQFIDQKIWKVIVDDVAKFIDDPIILSREKGWEHQIEDIVERSLLRGVRAMFANN